MSFVVGIDSSTTATKALLIDGDGVVRGLTSASYGYETPRPQWTEQDPHLWWDAAASVITRLLAEAGISGSEVAAVGMTGQMHGSVLLDADGEVVRPAILWNDQRTSAECDEIRNLVGKARLVATTGNDAVTGFTAPKLLWVRNHEPDRWGKVAYVLLPKDYVRYRLTGEFATDVADGSGTMLFDIAARTWSRDILDALDLDPDLLPPTFEGPEITGSITAKAAEATGLSPGTPVVGGGGDQAANAVGVGAVRPGIVALSLGTSGVVFATTQRAVFEPEGRVHAFCHAVPARWHMMGVMLSAGGSLRWLRDTVAPPSSFDDLVSSAGAVAACSEGLLFLPYLTGERTPHPDPLARGAFVGLTIRHDLRHLTRAVLEGVAFGLADGLDLMLAAGMPAPSQIRASGGGIKSGLWRQILADVLDTEIATVNTAEGAAYGAGLLAAVGAGWFETVEDACEATLTVEPVAWPGPDAPAYRHAHDRYKSLYPALAPSFHATP
jgi:xylulokinase